MRAPATDSAWVAVDSGRLPLTSHSGCRLSGVRTRDRRPSHQDFGCAIWR